MRAIIFDLDGTIAETEENHRQAFNQAFLKAGLDWVWEPELYRKLLKIAGGKERISHYIKEYQADFPLSRAGELHLAKDKIYQAGLKTIKLRPGIREIFAQALSAGVTLAVATTTRRANLLALFKILEIEPGIFQTIACGEDCANKKPAPDIYLKVLEDLKLGPLECLAIEDSQIGLQAASQAGIPVIITPSLYTQGDDFTTALAILPDLAQISLDDLFILQGNS